MEQDICRVEFNEKEFDRSKIIVSPRQFRLLIGLIIMVDPPNDNTINNVMCILQETFICRHIQKSALFNLILSATQ